MAANAVRARDMNKIIKDIPAISKEWVGRCGGVLEEYGGAHANEAISSSDEKMPRKQRGNGSRTGSPVGM